MQQERTELARERAALRHKVKVFLEGMPSLNAAVKTWPGVIDFVPSEYVERMRKPSPRSENAERARRAAEEFAAGTIGDLARAKILQSVADTTRGS